MPETSPLRMPTEAHPSRPREKPKGLPAMIAKRGGRLNRITIRLNPERATMLHLCCQTVAVLGGRPVSRALLIRRALDHYGDHLTALLASKDRQAQRAEAGALLACRG